MAISWNHLTPLSLLKIFPFYFTAFLVLEPLFEETGDFLKGILLKLGHKGGMSTFINAVVIIVFGTLEIKEVRPDFRSVL